MPDYVVAKCGLMAFEWVFRLDKLVFDSWTWLLFSIHVEVISLVIGLSFLNGKSWVDLFILKVRPIKFEIWNQFLIK